VTLKSTLWVTQGHLADYTQVPIRLPL